MAQPLVVGQQRVLVALENHGHPKDPIVLRTIRWFRVGNMDRFHDRRIADTPAARTNYAGEAGFGELGKRVRVLARVDDPKPVACAAELVAIAGRYTV